MTHQDSVPVVTPVRVLWLIKGLGPGGAERLLVAFARLAGAESLSAEVAYVRPDKAQLAPELGSLGVTSHLLSGAGRHWIVTLRELLASGGFDVVHAHSPLLAGVVRLLVRTVPRMTRPKVATTEHNEWGSYARRTRLLNALSAPLDSHRWAVSRRVRASMWPWVAKGTEVLIQGIEFDRFHPAPDARQKIRRELDIPTDAVVAVSVANLRRPKDYPNLLRATRAVRQQIPNFIVLILGQGPLKEEIEGLHAELNLGDSVRFLGFRSDVADVLAASDIFVIASAHEGGPLSLIEAMRSGLPSVATDVGFVSDVIDPGVHGLIVPTRNHDELAKAFVTLCRDGDLRVAMGRAARSASGRFDIRKTVERQLEVYRQLAGVEGVPAEHQPE